MADPKFEVINPETPGSQSGGMIQVAQSRAAQEVQAMVVVAKKFPRDEDVSFAKMMKACKRKSLAEVALYSYPRGTSKVEGPTIRLAEMMAQYWGNIDFGIIELEQRVGESTCMAYAWDMETNTRETKTFTVPHERHINVEGGGKKVIRLTDPRDVYENNANHGARRLRACLFAVLPGDFVDSCVDECNKTLDGDNSEPMADKIRSMVAKFAEYGVTKEMIEARLQHNTDSISRAELVALGKIYNALKDGAAKVADFFVEPKKEEAKAEEGGGSKADRLANKLGGAK